MFITLISHFEILYRSKYRESAARAHAVSRGDGVAPGWAAGGGRRGRSGHLIPALILMIRLLESSR